MDDLEADGADGLLDQSEMDIALSARQLRFSEGSGVSAGGEGGAAGGGGGGGAPGDAAFAAAEAACAAGGGSALGGTGTAEVLASLGFALPAAPAPAPPAPPAFPSALAPPQQPAAAPAAAALAPRAGGAPAGAPAAAAPLPPPQHQPVEVYVRVRPLNAEERHRGEASTIAVADERTLLTTAPVVRAATLRPCLLCRLPPRARSQRPPSPSPPLFARSAPRRAPMTAAAPGCSSTPSPAPFTTALTTTACSRRRQRRA
jgi:hypothetical protein